MLPADRTTAIFASNLVMIRAYDCERASVPVPRENALGWHSLAMMREGRFVKEVEGEPYLSDTTRGVFFNAGEPYRVWHPDECGDAITEFVLDDELLAEMVTEIDPGDHDPLERPFRAVDVAISPQSYLCHHATWAAADAGPREPVAIEETVIAFMAEALCATRDTAGRQAPERRTRKRASTRRAHAELARAARVRLSHRHRASQGLDALASELDVSPFHLCRVFRAETGTSVHHYLTDVRLCRAARALADPRADLTTVALDHGFSDLSHFSRSFRARFGLPPSQVRGRDATVLARELSRIVQDG